MKIIKILIGRLTFIPIIKKWVLTKESQTPILLKAWFIQKILGFNRNVYWPVHHSSIVGSPEKIRIGVDTNPGYMPGCYIQGMGGIVIGDYTQIASNVGFISKNHSAYDSRDHLDVDFPSIKIGEYCWIGMNSVILPGVKLGDFTVVGAGSVVTKSFEDGYCVVAGNPAKVIKKLDSLQCKRYVNKYEYIGYIEKNKFDEFRSKYLRV